MRFTNIYCSGLLIKCFLCLCSVYSALFTRYLFSRYTSRSVAEPVCQTSLAGACSALWWRHSALWSIRVHCDVTRVHYRQRRSRCDGLAGRHSGWLLHRCLARAKTVSLTNYTKWCAQTFPPIFGLFAENRIKIDPKTLTQYLFELWPLRAGRPSVTYNKHQFSLLYTAGARSSISPKLCMLIYNVVRILKGVNHFSIQRIVFLQGRKCWFLVTDALSKFNTVRPRAGSGVVRMDPLHFLAGCRTRRLNQV